MAFFRSLGLVAFFNNIPSSLARKEFMASPANFRISTLNPSGPTDLFLQIFANHFQTILMLIIKVSHELANCIVGMVRS
jgi:hypothetical protein